MARRPPPAGGGSSGEGCGRRSHRELDRSSGAHDLKTGGRRHPRGRARARHRRATWVGRRDPDQATTHVPPFGTPTTESLTCPGWPCLGRVGELGAEPRFGASRYRGGPDSWHAGGGDPRAVLCGRGHPVLVRRGPAGTRASTSAGSARAPSPARPCTGSPGSGRWRRRASSTSPRGRPGPASPWRRVTRRWRPWPAAPRSSATTGRRSSAARAGGASPRARRAARRRVAGRRAAARRPDPREGVRRDRAWRLRGRGSTDAGTGRDARRGRRARRHLHRGPDAREARRRQRAGEAPALARRTAIASCTTATTA